MTQSVIERKNQKTNMSVCDIPLLNKIDIYNKCSVLSITLKRNSIFHDYNILGATLKRVTNHDYLGVTI